MDFLKLFWFPLSDLHLSGRSLLWFSKVCSLVKFLYKYCLCVNQLYRKKKMYKTRPPQKHLYPFESSCNHFFCIVNSEIIPKFYSLILGNRQFSILSSPEQLQVFPLGIYI